MGLSLDFSGKVCVVTGASRGLGTCIARDYAAYGAKVVGAGRNGAALERLAKELTSGPGEFIPAPADVSTIEGCRSVVETAMRAHGRIDVLVNNAAMTGYHTGIRDLQPDQWQKVIDTNLTSVYACIHFAVAGMIERKTGVIINVSSAGTRYPSPNRTDYIGSKGGLEQLTRVLAHELGPSNIRVNTVTPGFMDNERTSEALVLHSNWRSMTPAQVEQEFMTRSALGRRIPPEEVSHLVCFLSSGFANSITGQNVYVDCGLAFN